MESIVNEMLNFEELGELKDSVQASNSNIMNAMQRCILTLYTYDSMPDDISPINVLRQSLAHSQ